MVHPADSPVGLATDRRSRRSSNVRYAAERATPAFVLLHLELWPLRVNDVVMRRPLLGLACACLAVAMAAPELGLGLAVAGLASAEFLVTVPVPFLFGSIVVLTTLEGSLFARFTRPVRGAVSVELAVAIGLLLALVYVLLCHTCGATCRSAPRMCSARCRSRRP